jgi:hypothetical protein
MAMRLKNGPGCARKTAPLRLKNIPVYRRQAPGSATEETRE